MWADLDQDNNLDIALLTINPTRCYWIKNLGDQVNFSAPIMFPGDFSSLNYIYFMDVDNDRDQDMISYAIGLEKMFCTKNFSESPQLKDLHIWMKMKTRSSIPAKSRSSFNPLS
ncbi:MAG: VCBS repeat-containing protein [Saprospirales bacterium]|nr:VCBS repeat-containing protein [Saprospirales bacterium]